MAKLNANYEAVYILDPNLGEEATAPLWWRSSRLWSRTTALWPRLTSGASAIWPIPSTT